MKIGIFLGSFDPIHISHVNLVSILLNSKLVDRVLVCPTVQNPWKDRTPAPFEIRCEMLDAALEPLQETFPGRVLVNDFEKTLKAPVYSYMLLDMIRTAHSNDELYIICGEDLIPSIKNWKNFDINIRPYFKYMMFKRSNDSNDNHEIGVSDSFFNEEVEMEGINISLNTNNISSSLIRDLVGNGKCPYPLVNKEVYNIIKRERLYGFKN